MKRIAVIASIFLLGLGVYFFCKPAPLPTADLASPSQEVRDAAAKILRVKAKPPSKSIWSFRFTVHLRKGESKTNILALLRSYNLSAHIAGGYGGIGEYDQYRLDDYWLLGVYLDNNDYTNLPLVHWKLVPRWREFYVQPPTNFSGVWTTYYANGQKSTEGHFQNGLRSGAFAIYQPDGWNNTVWNYENDKINGMWTQYYPSGQIEIQCLYSNQHRVGDMVSYYENSSKKFVCHYDDGRANGPSIGYFQSGKISYQCINSNGQRIGLAVRYNEDGTTNSVENHSGQ
jgi:hypothetical protein